MDHILRNFPEHEKQIRELVQNNAAFCELCNDFEEISIWLVSQTQQHIRSDEEMVIARELKRDLEEDIVQLLEREG